MKHIVTAKFKLMLNISEENGNEVKWPRWKKICSPGEPKYVDGSDLAKTEVQNQGIGVDAVLKQFGRKGKATGCVVLHLSTDNRRVERANFVVRGELEEKEIRMECSKLWQDADLDTIVTIRFPRIVIFKFEEGGLWSELVPDEEIVHYFHARAVGLSPTPIRTIAEGEFPLGPKQTTAWQCPILPLIVPGTSFATLAVAPTADRLRQGIANVMT